MSSPSPSTTVVIPVRDGEAVLVRCLRALARQSRAPEEVVVVDNASSDASAAIARTWGARVVREPRHGTPAAAARGYDAVESDLILRLDADSVPPPTWVEQVAERFVADPGIDAVTGSARFTGLPPLLARGLGTVYLNLYYRAFASLLGMPVLFGSNLAMRRSAWDAVSAEVHRDDAVMHDDLDLAIHLVAAGRRLAVDRSIEVAVSSAPLGEPAGLLTRATRAAYTVARHPDLHLALPLRPPA